MQASLQRVLGVAAPLLLLAPGCASTFAKPPVAHSSASGEVRAWTEADAARAALELGELGPKIRALLGSQRGPPRVMLAREQIPGPVGAFLAGDQIVIGAEAREQECVMLAHELAHWYLDGAWVALPGSLEEGVADLVAGEVLPEWSAALRGEHAHALETAAPLPDPGSALQLSCETCVEPGDEAQLRATRALGYAVAHRIGLARLRELCQAARTARRETLSSALLMEEARLAGSSLDDWRHALDPRMQVTFRAADGTVLATGEFRLPGHGQVPAGSVSQEIEILD